MINVCSCPVPEITELNAESFLSVRFRGFHRKHEARKFQFNLKKKKRSAHTNGQKQSDKGADL